MQTAKQQRTDQPNEAAQDEREDITDLDAQLPGRGHDDGISALSPAQVGLLGLQVMDDSSQVGQGLARACGCLGQGIPACLQHQSINQYI